MDGTLFETVDGEPVPAVTADEMREVDRVAVEDVGIDLLQMMENAGRNLAAQARAMANIGASTAGGRADASGAPVDDTPAVTVVAGNGGNGGGGLACARHLANRGVEVSVVLDRPPADLDGVAARQHRILDAMDVPVAVGTDAFSAPGLVVDALVGYGLAGPLRGTAADLVRAVSDADPPVLSLDVPSGRDATGGEEPGVAVAPDGVLTLALPKTGLAGAEFDLWLADISVPAVVYDRLDLSHESPFGDRYRVELLGAD